MMELLQENGVIDWMYEGPLSPESESLRQAMAAGQLLRLRGSKLNLPVPQVGIGHPFCWNLNRLAEEKGVKLSPLIEQCCQDSGSTFYLVQLACSLRPSYENQVQWLRFHACLQPEAKAVPCVFDIYPTQRPLLTAPHSPRSRLYQEGKPANGLLSQLRKRLQNGLTEQQLRGLCFEVGVTYENLVGQKKVDKARELIIHIDNRGQIPQLIAIAQHLYPALPWPTFTPKDDKATSFRYQVGVTPAFHFARVVNGSGQPWVGIVEHLAPPSQIVGSGIQEATASWKLTPCGQQMLEGTWLFYMVVERPSAMSQVTVALHLETMIAVNPSLSLQTSTHHENDRLTTVICDT